MLTQSVAFLFANYDRFGFDIAFGSCPDLTMLGVHVVTVVLLLWSQPSQCKHSLSENINSIIDCQVGLFLDFWFGQGAASIWKSSFLIHICCVLTMQGLKVRRDKNEKTGLRDYLVRRFATGVRWMCNNMYRHCSCTLVRKLFFKFCCDLEFVQTIFVPGALTLSCCLSTYVVCQVAHFMYTPRSFMPWMRSVWPMLASRMAWRTVPQHRSRSRALQWRMPRAAFIDSCSGRDCSATSSHTSSPS